MLKKLIKNLFTFPPSEADRLRKVLADVKGLHEEQRDATDQHWRQEFQALVNEHHDERRAWHKEKQELTAELNRLRDVAENTQSLMKPHLTGKTRVSSLGNVRMQIDVPRDDDSNPLDLLSGFAWLLIDAGYGTPDGAWAAKIQPLLKRTPPQLSNPSRPPLRLDEIADLQRTPLPRIHSISPE